LWFIVYNLEKTLVFFKAAKIGEFAFYDKAIALVKVLNFKP